MMFYINHIVRDGDYLLVGVTDEERWLLELKDNHSGADAKTLLSVVINLKSGTERISIHVSLIDDLRESVIKIIPMLLDEAHSLYEREDPMGAFGRALSLEEET